MENILSSELIGALKFLDYWYNNISRGSVVDVLIDAARHGIHKELKRRGALYANLPSHGWHLVDSGKLPLDR